MANITKQEIELVKERLSIFEGRIPQKHLDSLLADQPKEEKHALFYFLSNSRSFPVIKECLEIIKQFNKKKYLPKVLSKLLGASRWLNQQKAVFEMIVASYYFQKFMEKKPIFVEWERETLWGKKLTGVSLSGLDKIVHLEVMNLADVPEIQKKQQLLYKLQIELESQENLKGDGYFYIINLFSNKKYKLTSSFSQKNIPDFVDFVPQSKEEGAGKYFFPNTENPSAYLEIKKISDIQDGIVSRFDVWSEALKGKKMRELMVSNSCENLFSEEDNFLFLPNLGGVEEEDVRNAFLGEKKREDIPSGLRAAPREPNGAINRVYEKGCPSCHALIYSGLNYEKRGMVSNPLLPREDKIFEIIK